MFLYFFPSLFDFFVSWDARRSFVRGFVSFISLPPFPHIIPPHSFSFHIRRRSPALFFISIKRRMGLRSERHNKLRLFHLRLCLTQRQSLFGSQKYTSNCISSKPPAREEGGGRTRQEEAPPRRVCVCDVSENVSISKCKQKKRWRKIHRCILVRRVSCDRCSAASVLFLHLILGSFPLFSGQKRQFLGALPRPATKRPFSPLLLRPFRFE